MKAKPLHPVRGVTRRQVLAGIGGVGTKTLLAASLSASIPTGDPGRPPTPPAAE
ncbi:MAG TPA: hypothetical protein VGG23_05020 [Acidimicrobiales bacterium]